MTASGSVGAVIAEAPAKVNLFLYVTRRRSDGYHELYSLMCCVGLYDTLAFDFTARGIAVRCRNPSVPEDESNTAHRAALSFFSRLPPDRNRPASGVRIDIQKRIPVAAGLGGGSSDAAAVLSVLNRHFGQPFSRPQLSAMALEIGADVPFFLYRRPALATGVGERLRPVKGLAPRKVLLVCPPCAVSTREVFKKLNLALTKGEKKPKSCPLNVQKIDINRYLHNDLESVTLAIHPDIDRIKSRLIDCKATGAIMSGSGPTVVGLFGSGAAALEAGRRLAGEKLGRVFLVDMPV